MDWHETADHPPLAGGLLNEEEDDEDVDRAYERIDRRLLIDYRFPDPTDSARMIQPPEQHPPPSYKPSSASITSDLDSSSSSPSPSPLHPHSSTTLSSSQPTQSPSTHHHPPPIDSPPQSTMISSLLESSDPSDPDWSVLFIPPTGPIDQNFSGCHPPQPARLESIEPSLPPSNVRPIPSTTIDRHPPDSRARYLDHHLPSELQHPQLALDPSFPPLEPANIPLRSSEPILRPVHPPELQKCQRWLKDLPTTPADYSDERLPTTILGGRNLSTIDEILRSSQVTSELGPNHSGSQCIYHRNKTFDPTPNEPSNIVVRPTIESIEGPSDHSLDPSIDLSSSHLKPEDRPPSTADPKGCLSHPTSSDPPNKPRAPSNPSSSQGSESTHPPTAPNTSPHRGSPPSSVLSTRLESQNLDRYAYIRRWSPFFNLGFSLLFSFFVLSRYWKNYTNRAQDDGQEESSETTTTTQLVSTIENHPESSDEELINLKAFPPSTSDLSSEGQSPSPTPTNRDELLFKSQDQAKLVTDEPILFNSLPDPNPDQDLIRTVRIDDHERSEPIPSAVLTSSSNPSHDRISSPSSRDSTKKVGDKYGERIDFRDLESFDPIPPSAPHTPHELPSAQQVNLPPPVDRFSSALTFSLFLGAFVFVVKGLFPRGDHTKVHGNHDDEGPQLGTVEVVIELIDATSSTPENHQGDLPSDVILNHLKQLSTVKASLVRLVKVLEGRIRTRSTRESLVELGLLAWSKEQLTDYEGSSKLWARFWDHYEQVLRSHDHQIDGLRKLEGSSTPMMNVVRKLGSTWLSTSGTGYPSSCISVNCTDIDQATGMDQKVMTSRRSFMLSVKSEDCDEKPSFNSLTTKSSKRSASKKINNSKGQTSRSTDRRRSANSNRSNKLNEDELSRSTQPKIKNEDPARSDSDQTVYPSMSTSRSHSHYDQIHLHDHHDDKKKNHPTRKTKTSMVIEDPETSAERSIVDRPASRTKTTRTPRRTPVADSSPVHRTTKSRRSEPVPVVPTSSPIVLIPKDPRSKASTTSPLPQRSSSSSIHQGSSPTRLSSCLPKPIVLIPAALESTPRSRADPRLVIHSDPDPIQSPRLATKATATSQRSERSRSARRLTSAAVDRS